MERCHLLGLLDLWRTIERLKSPAPPLSSHAVGLRHSRLIEDSTSTSTSLEDGCRRYTNNHEMTSPDTCVPTYLPTLEKEKKCPKEGGTRHGGAIPPRYLRSINT